MSEVVLDASDRDIDLVLITGAGASRSFGVEGKPMPLMGEWSDDLVQRLAGRGSGFLSVAGLQREMDGPAFEDQLGRFIRSVAAFKSVDGLLEPMTQFPVAPFNMVADGQWSEWHRQRAFALDQVIAVIHESLYSLFAGPFDRRGAEQAYGELLAALVVGPTSRLVYATTNYDVIGEETLAVLDRLPDVGEFQPSALSPERVIRPDRLLDGLPRYTPVLHLHGRVGWFQPADGPPVSIPGSGYDIARGLPIVMLPDLEKDYERNQVINALWGQLAEALRRAKFVLVLGHSLHDEALLRVLATNVVPPSVLGVTFLPAAEDRAQPANDEARELLEVIQERLPLAVPVPLRFGPSLSGQTNALERFVAVARP